MLVPGAFSGRQICQNCFCDRGSAPDPAGGAYSAPPDPLAGKGEEYQGGKEIGGRKEKRRKGLGRKGEERQKGWREEKKVGEREGRGGEGSNEPPLQILDPPLLSQTDKVRNFKFGVRVDL